MKALARKILPSFVWNRLVRAKADVLSPANVQSFLDRAGYVVARRSDYYSPLTSVSDLRSTFGVASPECPERSGIRPQIR